GPVNVFGHQSGLELCADLGRGHSGDRDAPEQRKIDQAAVGNPAVDAELRELENLDLEEVPGADHVVARDVRGLKHLSLGGRSARDQKETADQPPPRRPSHRSSTPEKEKNTV